MDSIRAGEHAAAEWYRNDLEKVQNELLAVLRQHWPQVGTQLIAHVLVEVTGSVLATIMQNNLAAKADVLGRLDQLRLHLSVDGTRAQ